MNTRIVFAQESDAGEILNFIRELAKYEKLVNEMVATEDAIRKTLFGERPFAEVIFLEEGDGKRAGFALFFHNYSTFLGKPGIYLEDLFVLPEFRGRGYGKKLLAHLAKIAVDRNCGRLDWSVLDWNTSAIEFYNSLGAKLLKEWVPQRMTGSALTKLARLAAD
jgi:GNAT superfamily N-acetyltransferase